VTRKRWLISPIRYDEAHSSESEEETGRDALHDVLTVEVILHERHLCMDVPEQITHNFFKPLKLINVIRSEI